MAEEAESLLRQAEELRVRLEMVGRQLELLESLKADKARAHETLLAVQGSTAGAEILFPVGGNTFVRAVLGENANVLKGVGADVVLPRPLAVAVEDLKKEVAALDADLQTLGHTANEMEARYGEIVQYLQQTGAIGAEPPMQ